MALERTPLVKSLERRRLFRGSLSLGALALLPGCDISSNESVERFLRALSRWNDEAQAVLFSRTRLAPVYREDQVVHDFRYNAFFSPDDAPKLDAADYKLQLSGLIADKKPWTVDALHALPQQSQITRHVCVEGWSMIGKWGGIPLGDFLRRVGADTSAGYVGFECADGYYEALDMPTALHPQTFLALTFADQTLPRKYGFPFKIRVPTKLGFKNPKWVTTIYVTNRQPNSFWADRGYNWFSGS
ncbi:MAG TPA: molybdopterin-dependent oxidoreductase [Acetobacteraceae bacterium]|jgi:DMSO/TMAO reductase YedYZ molybdopterin-dependent catalytic subunit|nr:molybdopterin-dependent oxidoreductase [Acetobacteraceae bacterium]